MSGTPQVFLSYARSDKDVARRIADRLQREQIIVWSDQELEPGEDWVQATEHALGESRLVVLLLSPRYLDSSVASFERALATKASQETDKILLPVVVKHVDLDSLPPSLKRLQVLDATRNVDLVWDAVRKALDSTRPVGAGAA